MKAVTNPVVLLYIALVLFIPNTQDANGQSPDQSLVTGYSAFIAKSLDNGQARIGLNVTELIHCYSFSCILISPETKVNFTSDQVTFGLHEALLSFSVNGSTVVRLGNFITPFQTWKTRFHRFPDNDASASQPWESTFGPLSTNGVMVSGRAPIRSTTLAYNVYAGLESDEENLFSGTRNILGLRAQVSSPSGNHTFGYSAAVDNFRDDPNGLYGLYYLVKIPRIATAASFEAACSQAIGCSLWNTTVRAVNERLDMIFKFEALERSSGNQEYPYSIAIPTENAVDAYLGFRGWLDKQERIRWSAQYKFGVENTPHGMVSTVTISW